MTELVLDYGYFGLFVFTLLASTLIAAPADVVAIAMPQLGFDPFMVGAVGTVAAYLGNLVNYYVGLYGTRFFLSRFISVDKESRWTQRASDLYKRFGVFSLLLSGVPFIGDPITTIAGGFRVNVAVFTVLVVVSKIIKYGMLLGAADWIIGT